ncbi:MAG: glycosyl hydrolase, partial [Proteobacteria bacterium]|nr:glycosyl hydrolase [Pseudomonadota bacterium]
FVLNVKFPYSKDGGSTFSEIDTPHGDNHDLWIDPADPLRMIQSNDGGANVSVDRGETWSVQSNQPTAQFYRVSTDNDFPYRLLGGQQDNSAVRIRSRSAFGDVIGVRDWEPTAGGESGHIAAKPDDPDIVVGGSYGGYLRVVNHRTGTARAIDVWPDNPMGWGAAELKYRFQWNFPVVFSVHDPDVLYVAADVLFRSSDLGQTWEPMSPDLTRNDKSRMQSSGGPITKDNTSVEYFGTIFALAESQHEPDVMWVGTDDGLVHVTRNGGTTWTDVTPAGLPEWAQINSLEIHPYEQGGAYLAATRYKSDDFRPYLYRTTDWGASWQKITNGIPPDHFTRALRSDPDREGLLYAGTEFGVYYSVDDGRNWLPIQLNLPVVPITDLAVKEQDLIAATQGRGYWILDDLTVLHQTTANTASKAVHLFSPRPAYRLTAGGRSDEPVNAGMNPPVGVVFNYSLAEEPGEETEMSLQVFESRSDEAIWTWTRKPEGADVEEEEEPDPNDPPDTRLLTSDKGLNRFVWDLRYPPMDRFDNLIMWADMKEGPKAVPGLYRARLTVGDASQDVTFNILPDPRSSSTAEDYAAQFNFVMDATGLLSRTHVEIRKIRQLRTQLESLQARLEKAGEGDADTAELIAEVATLLETITPIEEALYQTRNESRQDPLNFPIRLNNKLTSLMRTVAVGDARPTAGAIAVKNELTTAIETELEQLESIWNENVPALNSRIQSMGVDLVTISDE